MRAILVILFILSFSISLQISIYYPIYSDEFEWKLISSRFILDQKKSLYLFPACINSYFTDTPLSSYLGRFLDSLVYQGVHVQALLREMGLFQYFILIVLYWHILTIQSKLHPLKSLLLILSIFSIGVLPILMVLNRPEQPLLIYVTLCIYLSVLKTHKPCCLLNNNGFVTLIFCLLSILIITTHPKGIYLIPIVFVAYRTLVKSRIFLSIFLSITLWVTFQTVQLWSLRTSCSESPWMESLVKSFNLNPNKIFTEPIQFFIQVVKNLVRFYTYIGQILFSMDYQSQWLPNAEALVWTKYILWLINSLSLILIMGVFGFIGVRFYKINIIKNNSYNRIALAITISLIVITVMQVAKNFYESTLIFPLLILLFFFLINPVDIRSRKFLTNVALPALLVVGSISSITRYIVFVDFLPKWRLLPIKVLNDNKRLEDFVFNQCGINSFDSGLVVDRQTYPIFWKHSRPIFTSALTGWYGTGTDYKVTLNRLGSDGVIAMCTGLPSELRVLGREDLGVCCVSKSNLQLLIKQ